MRSTKSISGLILAAFLLLSLALPAAPLAAQDEQSPPAPVAGAEGGPDQAAVEAANSGRTLEIPEEVVVLPAPEPVQAPVALTEAMHAGPNGLELAPFLSMIHDPQGRKSVVDMILPENADSFAKYDKVRAMAAPGTLWLRFSSRDLPSQAWFGLDVDRNMLDLGLQVPGKASVWLVRGDEGLPIEVSSGLDNVFQLPSPTNNYQVLIKIDGQPGLWFSPVLSTMSEATSSLYRLIHWLCLGALGVLCLLGLVRGISERGDGRIWTGVFCGGALAYAFFGLPASPHGVILAQGMPGVIGAAVALLFLPHVGRQVTRSSGRWGFADTMFLLLALVGAAATLIPLMPGFAFATPYIALWPAGASLSLLPSLILMLRGVRGSGLFSLACLLMIGGAAAGYLMIDSPLYAQVWAEAPLLGVVAGSLLLAVTVPRHALTRPAPSPRRTDEDEDNPAARLAAQGSFTNYGQNAGQDSAQNFATALRMEEVLRAPLDSMLRDVFNLDQTLDRNLEAPTREGLGQAREFADRVLAGSRQMSKLISDFPRYTEQGYSPTESPEPFELRRLIQKAFASVREELAGRELGLAWYISPYIGLHYKGDKDRLIYVLSLLLKDAVRATNHGMVSIRVRRTDTSINPGHIQFSISDSGKVGPPLGRSSLMLARAWELAADYKGELYVNCTPLGVEVTFGLDCTALETDGRTQKPHAPERIPDIELPGPHNPNLVIVASSNHLNRQIFAYYLEGQGQVIWEARDADEALALYTYTPGAVVIFDGTLPEPDVIATIAAIRAFEGEHLLPNAALMALSLDDVQAERLLQAGCTSSLTQPVRRQRFRQLVFDLATKPRATPLPTPPVILQEARIEEEDGSKASLDVKLDLSAPEGQDLPPFIASADEPKKARKQRFPWRGKDKKDNEMPVGVEPIVPLSYTVTPPPTAKDGQISPDDLKSRAGKEFAPLKLNRPKNLSAPPPEYFSTGYVSEPVPVSKPAQPPQIGAQEPEAPAPEARRPQPQQTGREDFFIGSVGEPKPIPKPAPVEKSEPQPAPQESPAQSEGALVITAASLAAEQGLHASEQAMLAKVRQVINADRQQLEGATVITMADKIAPAQPVRLAHIEQFTYEEDEVPAQVSESGQPQISFWPVEPEDTAAEPDLPEAPEAAQPEREQPAPTSSEAPDSPMAFLSDKLEAPEQPEPQAVATDPDPTSADEAGAPKASPERPLITTERTSHLQAQGFVLPAQPKKKKGWLGNLFKPTPKLPEEDQAGQAEDPEQVGRPAPRQSQAATAELPLDPYQVPVFSEVSEPRPIERIPAPQAEPLPQSLTIAPKAEPAPEPVAPQAASAPEQSIAVAAKQPLPDWYSPLADDESVGEPVPVSDQHTRAAVAEPLQLQRPAPAPDLSKKRSRFGRAKDEPKAELPLPATEPAPQQSHLLDNLDMAMRQAEYALQTRDQITLQTSAGLIGKQAETYGLHGLADLAKYMGEAAASQDFGAVSQILPDLRSEINRQRGS